MRSSEARIGDCGVRSAARRRWIARLYALHAVRVIYLHHLDTVYCNLYTMASRFAAGIFGRNLTATSAGAVRAHTAGVRRLATAAGENEFVAERMHHKEHAASEYHLTQTVGSRDCTHAACMRAFDACKSGRECTWFMVQERVARDG